MIYAVGVAAVILLLIGVSVYQARAVKSRTDFLVAGRNLPWPVLVFTLLSSWIGAGSLLAGAENAYREGVVALWQPLGGWLGLVLVALIAGRARKFAQYTVPDLLQQRYGAAAGILASIAIVVSNTTIASYQLIGGGDILHLIIPSIDHTTGIVIIAVFVIFFTAAAGMASIAQVDLFVGTLVSLTVLAAVPALWIKAGGWTHVRLTLPSSHFHPFGTGNLSHAIGLALPTMLLLVGNQGMYQKFFSARSENDARKAVIGWIVGTTILETLLVTFAIVASSILKTDRPREIIALTAKTELPPLLGAILLGGVFAKVISTANNYLFSPATNLIHDVYERFTKREIPEKQLLAVSRLIIVLLGVFATLQATAFDSILKAALYAYTIYGAAVTPAVLSVFLVRRVTPRAATTSILLGTVVTIAWQLAQEHGSSVIRSLTRPIDAIYPALALSILSLLLVSFLPGNHAGPLHTDRTINSE